MVYMRVMKFNQNRIEKSFYVPPHQYAKKIRESVLYLYRCII